LLQINFLSPAVFFQAQTAPKPVSIHHGPVACGSKPQPPRSPAFDALILIVIFEFWRDIIHSTKTMRHGECRIGCSSWVLKFLSRLLRQGHGKRGVRGSNDSQKFTWVSNMVFWPHFFL